MNARPVAAFWALAVVAAPGVGNAQSLGVAQGRDLPEWMTAWSPTDSHADLPRLLPSASGAMPLLLLPPPRVGLFWLAGNPGALPAEVGPGYSNFVAARSGQSGDYHRPLDPGGASLTQVSALSWQPAGRRAGAIGRIVVDQELLDPGTYADQAQPYTSNPFAVTDTLRSPMRRIRARLEGAAGTRVAGWGLGAALGYETRDSYTRHAAFIRFDRQVTPAAALGITRSFGDSGLVLGVHGRWSGGAETVDLYQNTLTGRVYQLEGYADVAARDVAGYHRRTESDEVSGGAGASGVLAGAHWTVFGEAAHYREGLWSQLYGDNPPKDHWEVRAWSVGAAVQRTLFGARWLVTIEGRYTSLSGSGDLARDSAGAIFRARERSLSASAELRLLPTADGWTGLALLRAASDRRQRTDSVAGIGTDLRAPTLGLAIEAGRAVLKRLFVAAGAAYASYLPRGQIPSPLARGTAYQALIAPEIELEATEADVQAYSLSLRWQARDDMALWAAARWESLAPTTFGLSRISVFRPGGERTAQFLAVGVVLN